MAATDAPVERATVLAFVDTVLIQEEIILKELGSNLLFFPLSFLINLVYKLLLIYFGFSQLSTATDTGDF